MLKIQNAFTEAKDLSNKIFKKSETPFEKKKKNLFSKFFTSFFFQRVKAFTKVTYLKY